MSLKIKKLFVFFALSALLIKPSFAEITFQEILENPADLEINLKYATEQVALGRYKATLSTLERLNMLYPVNTDIKNYLLSILLKMDS
jgi:Flp pilus assembly protein TadD